MRARSTAHSISIGQLFEQFIERRNVRVALDHSADATEPFKGTLIQSPHGTRDWGIVRINDESLLPFMAGEMNLCDAFSGHAADECLGVEMMIDAVHVDIVHIEQQQTIRPRAKLGQKLP